MEVGPAGPAPVRYWAPGLRADPLFRNDDDYADAYRQLLNDAVRRHSRSHRPVACEVSGGLDSSAIFAVAVDAGARGDLGAPGLEGYTLDFQGVPDADELEYVRAVETHLGTQVRRVEPAQPPVAWYREQARLSREFPGYPNGAMAEHLRETARARGARVLLAGVGGDEWLGLGPPGHYYAEELALGNLREAAACLRTDIRLLGLPGAAAWAVRAGLVPLLPDSVKRVGRRLRGTPPPRESWLASPLEAEATRRRALQASRRLHEAPRRSQRWQLETLMDAYSAVAREMEERSAARIGLELRLPFFDHRIVEFAFSTPERLRSIGRSMKHLHRRALEGLLPPLVLSRQTKADFMVVFRNQLDRLERELRTDIAGRRGGWIRPERAAYLVDHRQDPGVAGWVEWWLWALVGCDALV
jgi:asparagine synthase (glutamine-hydrolysing)